MKNEFVDVMKDDIRSYRVSFATENCTKLVKQGLFNNFMFHDTLSRSCNDAGTIPTTQTFVLVLCIFHRARTIIIIRDGRISTDLMKTTNVQTVYF